LEEDRKKDWWDFRNLVKGGGVSVGTSVSVQNVEFKGS